MEVENTGGREAGVVRGWDSSVLGTLTLAFVSLVAIWQPESGVCGAGEWSWCEIIIRELELVKIYLKE